MRAEFKPEATYDDGHSWEETEDRHRVQNGWMVWEYCTRCEVQRQVRTFDSGDSRPVWMREPDPTPRCKSVITDLEESGLGAALRRQPSQYWSLVQTMANLADSSASLEVLATLEEIASEADLHISETSQVLRFLIGDGILEKVDSDLYRFPDRQYLTDIAKHIEGKGISYSAIGSPRVREIRRE